MRKLLGAMALSIAMTTAGPGAALASDATRDEIRADLIRVVAAGEDMLDAQSDFNAARAAGDRAGMKDAAHDLVWSAAAVTFNAVMLDIAVTPDNTSAEVDAKAADLRILAEDVFQRLVPIILAGDFDALGARLDESAETLNRFFSLTRGISATPGLRGVI